LDAEPVVEVTLARELGEDVNGLFTHSKNPRLLHFNVNKRGLATSHKAYSRERFTVPKPLLADVLPDPDRTISDSELVDIVSWILARYERTAFPDEFNRRTKSAVDGKMKRALKGMPKLRSLYVSLSDPKELPKNESYVVTLLGVVRVEDYSDVDVRAAIEKGMMRIAAALRACEGIFVDEVTVGPENEVTLDDIRYLARWNFDYISLKESEAHVPPGRARP
jgi:hypothetical protein